MTSALKQSTSVENGKNDVDDDEARVNGKSGKNGAAKLPRQVVQIGREVCGELSLIEEREFLVTNGKGGYSSMTAACSLTRSYHGLLIAALRPPLDRTLLLSKLNETVTYLGRTYYLYTDRRSAASRYKTPRGGLKSSPTSSSPAPDKFNAVPKKHLSSGDVVSPLGYLHLDSVRLEGTVPVFTYAFADALLEKRIWMKQGQNTIFVTYYLRRGSDVVELDLAAWVNHRDHHHRTQPNSPRFDHSAVIVDESTVRVDYDLKSTKTQLFMRVERGVATLTNSWVSELCLDKERSRGLPHIDAALHAASFNVDLVPGSRVTFVATSESGDDNTAVSTNGDAELQLQHHHSAKLLDAYEMARSMAQQRRRNIAKQLHRSVPVVEQWPRSTRRRSGGFGGTVRRNLAPPEAGLTDAVRQLVLAADQFIIERGNGDSVVVRIHSNSFPYLLFHAY